MSLIHRRKSIIFNDPGMTVQKYKIRKLLQSHKQKLQLNKCSSSTPKKQCTEKLSLHQAIKLEDLYMQAHKTRRMTLNTILNGFDENCTNNIVEQTNTIDTQRLDLFRSGVYYKSLERAKGTGAKKGTKQSLLQYFNYQDIPVTKREKFFETIGTSNTTSNLFKRSLKRNSLSTK